MDELRHALHAAAAEPPPTHIDLDDLIDGTRRRSRLQYRIGAVAGAVALTTGAVLVPTVLLPAGGIGTAGGGGGAPPSACPSLSPVPVPSESLGVVAGPTYDPSVPEASRHPMSSDPPVDTSPPATASPEVSPSPPVCVRPGRAITCPAGSPSPSGSPGPSGSQLQLAMCIRFLPALRGAPGDAFPSGWQLAQAIVLPPQPDRSSYSFTILLVDDSTTMQLQLKLAREQPGTVLSRCGALAASVHAKASDCKVQPQGDAVLVVSAARTVYDVRPDGTTVTVTADSPATIDQLTALARSAELNMAN